MPTASTNLHQVEPPFEVSRRSGTRTAGSAAAPPANTHPGARPALLRGPRLAGVPSSRPRPLAFAHRVPTHVRFQQRQPSQNNGSCQYVLAPLNSDGGSNTSRNGAAVTFTALAGGNSPENCAQFRRDAVNAAT